MARTSVRAVAGFAAMLLAAAFGLSLASTVLVDGQKLETENYHISAADPGIQPSYQAQAYFAKLTRAPYKRFVELGEGTHTIIMEKNRMQFFREVSNFLNEVDPFALQ